MAYEEAELMDMVSSLSTQEADALPIAYQQQQQNFASPLSPPTTSTIVDESGARSFSSGTGGGGSPVIQREDGWEY